MDTEDRIKLRYEVEGQEKAVAAKRANDELALSTNRIDTSSKMASGSMFQLAQVMDDMQYVGTQGLRPVMNNIAFVMPQVAIAVIGAQVAFSGLKFAMNAASESFGGDDYIESAGSVEVLKKKVDELSDSYLSTTESARMLAQAEKDLKAARETEAIIKTPSAAQDDRAKSFREATKISGGGAVEAVVRQAASDAFGAGQDVEMVQRAIENKRIDPETAQGLGLFSRQDIARFLESGDPVNRSLIRSLTIAGTVNDTMSGLASGDQRAMGDFRGMLADSKLSARTPSGQFVNPIVQKIAGPETPLTSAPGGGIVDLGGMVSGATDVARLAADRNRKRQEDRDLAPFLADDERENERRLRARQQAREKAARDAERDQRAADREREQNTRVGANMFGEAFGNRAQMALMQGMNPQAIARAIQQQLVSTGALNPSQAGDAAGEIVRQAGADLQQSQTQAMAQFGNAMQANAAVMRQLIVNQQAMSAEYQRTAGQFFQLLQQSRGVFSRIQSSPMGSMRRNP